MAMVQRGLGVGCSKSRAACFGTRGMNMRGVLLVWSLAVAGAYVVWERAVGIYLGRAC